MPSSIGSSLRFPLTSRARMIWIRYCTCGPNCGCGAGCQCGKPTEANKLAENVAATVARASPVVMVQGAGADVEDSQKGCGNSYPWGSGSEHQQYVELQHVGCTCCLICLDEAVCIGMEVLLIQ